MVWQPALPGPAAASNTVPADATSDEEGDEITFPQDLHARAREVVPNITRQDCFRAWDAAHAAKTQDDRIQQTILNLLDQNGADEVPQPASVSPARPSADKGKKRAASVLSDSSSVELVPSKDASKSVKGKAPTGRKSVTVIGDSDDDQPGPSHVGPSPKRARVDTQKPTIIDEPVAGPSPTAKVPAIDLEAPQAAANVGQEDNMAHLSAIFPNLDLEHAAGLLQQFRDQLDGLDRVADYYFSLGADYPKRKLDKGKKRAIEPPLDSPGRKKTKNANDGKKELDDSWKLEEARWMRAGRPIPIGSDYTNLCLHYLCQDFPIMPKTHIRSTLKRKTFYASTFFQLRADLTAKPRPFKAIAARTLRSGTGVQPDADCIAEREWVARKNQYEAALAMAGSASKVEEKAEPKLAGPSEDADDDSGLLLDCPICGDSLKFSAMSQCAEAHLFCCDCLVSYAGGKIGDRKAEIICMEEGCDAAFPDSELKRLLPAKTFALIERTRAEKAVSKAELEGLAECPFCDNAYVIDNPDEKLFVCQAEDCGKTSCLKCKKEDHLPRSCKEVEDDAKKDQLHTISEAMTNALIKKCPNARCAQPYIKESGCNKMTCSACGSLSCFICGKIILGYGHFEGRGDNREEMSKGCILYDPAESAKIHANVQQAQLEAARMAQQNNPAINADDVALFNMPAAPVVPAMPHHHGHRHHRPYAPPPPPAPLTAEQIAMMAERQRLAAEYARQLAERQRIAAEEQAKIVARRRKAHDKDMEARAAIFQRAIAAEEAMEAARKASGSGGVVTPGTPEVYPRMNGRRRRA